MYTYGCESTYDKECNREKGAETAFGKTDVP